MGRALFSLSYPVPSPEPAVRTEPEPKVDECERWSSWNQFDPDSDAFFHDAPYEAFIDPVHLARQQADLAAFTAAAAAENSDSSEASDSDHGSPMAVGANDPAALIAGAYNAETGAAWDPDRSLLQDDWRLTSSRATFSPSMANFLAYSPPSPLETDHAGTPAFIPPPSFRAASPIEGRDLEGDSAAPLRSPVLPRTVDITPIRVSRIQIQPATRSPSPGTPATPPSQMTPSYLSQTMVTPSPPPTVTPRFYSWQHHPIPTLPTSPTVVRGANRDGPLPNPRARMSFTRIDAAPARVHVPSM